MSKKNIVYLFSIIMSIVILVAYRDISPNIECIRYNVRLSNDVSLIKDSNENKSKIEYEDRYVLTIDDNNTVNHLKKMNICPPGCWN